MRADWNLRAQLTSLKGKMESLGYISITLLVTSHDKLPKRERAGISIFSLCGLT
jgi:hypothetical protein